MGVGIALNKLLSHKPARELLGASATFELLLVVEAVLYDVGFVLERAR